MNSYKIKPIPAFKDNYIWLIFDEDTKAAWVVDPGDAKPVINILEQNNLNLKGVLLTHHHHDHTDGVSSLLDYSKNISIYGSHLSSISSITHPVKEGDVINSEFFKLTVMEIPGHTLDHIAFYNSHILFCGDTLFSFGCGRIFEGTPDQMYHSLNKLVTLRDETLIYCGHEYTLANLQFAQYIEPGNPLITEKINWVKTLYEKNFSSLPSTLHIEKALNPFLRCDQPSIISATESYSKKKLNNSVEVFSYLRQWKNNTVVK
ncbi:MAG: hydroxyacylglutathione hydrolase [Gammaproteobacteria bacterium]|nr:hydroxyacylglutathione hydrolase [Gammaproteobacteria bacterium]